MIVTAVDPRNIGIVIGVKDARILVELARTLMSAEPVPTAPMDLLKQASENVNKNGFHLGAFDVFLFLGSLAATLKPLTDQVMTGDMIAAIEAKEKAERQADTMGEPASEKIQ